MPTRVAAQVIPRSAPGCRRCRSASVTPSMPASSARGAPLRVSRVHGQLFHAKLMKIMPSPLLAVHGAAQAGRPSTVPRSNLTTALSVLGRLNLSFLPFVLTNPGSGSGGRATVLIMVSEIDQRRPGVRLRGLGSVVERNDPHATDHDRHQFAFCQNCAEIIHTLHRFSGILPGHSGAFTASGRSGQARDFTRLVGLSRAPVFNIPDPQNRRARGIAGRAR